MAGQEGTAVATTTRQLSPAEILERRIKEHREEVARFRERYGDPAVAMAAFLREAFSAEAFLETYRERQRDRGSWLDGEDDLDS